MPPNPYQSPDERGKKPQAPVANLWKVTCLVAAGAMLAGTIGINLIEAHWGISDLAGELCYILCLIAANAGLLVFVIAGGGWLVTSLRRR
jgi:hypothetical protein